MASSPGPSSEAGDVQLTIGVEWEFLFAFIPGYEFKVLEDGPGDPCGRPLVTLPCEHPLFEPVAARRVAQSLRPHLAGFSPGKIETIWDMRVKPYMRGYADHWMVKLDRSVGGYPGGEYHFTGLELTSPILRESDPQLGAMLVEATRALTRHDRVKRNETCALHVHVGVSGEEGWDMLTLKKLASLLWLAEDRLARLCHPDRSDNVYCLSLAKTSMLAVYTIEPGDPEDTTEINTWLAPLFGEAASAHAETQQRLTKLWSAKQRLILATMLRETCAGSLRYNFKNLVTQVLGESEAPNGPLDKRTVEFRMMDMTFNGKLVHAYTACCIRLVHCAKDLGIGEYQVLARELLKPETEYTIWQLLAGIGLDKQHIDELEKWAANGYEDPLDLPLAGADEAGIVQAQ
ncbi:uncharacterized protein E0L32_010848 [Thyridium curvatum]|uniref:Uncharacterized protein n=1 Tax=Thyridium curvatum TaxID=1093900 RepID=A0A507AM24_9PEZI|nr:uncharacterized protein E0L32_010848 [Thyridium curvatum]TPX07254.1 hypothetical protein E0L32_010848 [Thyridium curvatum]